jgi:lipopolysaccharide export system protein LptA
MSMKNQITIFHAALFALAALCAGISATAQAQTAKPARQGFGSFGSNNKAPINIEADRLDVSQKEEKATYSGNVVAVQAETTIRCSTLTVHFEQKKGGAAQASTGPQSAENSAIRELECAGPVTITSKTQTATGGHARYDRINAKVYLTGNVTLTDGPNITKGERLVYDINAGRGQIDGGRVRGLFMPGDAEKPKTR